MPFVFHTSSANSLQLKNGPGTLWRVVINVAAADVTIYDGTTAGSTMAILKASIAEGSYEYGCQFNKGLSAYVAGAVDVSIVFS